MIYVYTDCKIIRPIKKQKSPFDNYFGQCEVTYHLEIIEILSAYGDIGVGFWQWFYQGLTSVHVRNPVAQPMVGMPLEGLLEDCPK